MYRKIYSYGAYLEVFSYEKRPIATRRNLTRSREDARLDSSKARGGVLRLVDGKKDHGKGIQPQKVRLWKNNRRAIMAFRRLVVANLGELENPVLASFTFRENMGEWTRARAVFKAFARRASLQFGDVFKFISVVEFQKRGAIHFHALLWGLPSGAVGRERHTRLVASLWEAGFVDLVETDGSVKLALYLAKYFRKGLMDPRLFGKKLYTTSRNITKPKIDKDALLSDYPEISTATVLQKKEYSTQWLGMVDYKQYEINSYDSKRHGGNCGEGSAQGGDER